MICVPQWKSRAIVQVVVSIFVTILLALYAFDGQAQQQDVIPKAVRGVIDLRSINLNAASIPLEGEWEFYPNQLLKPTVQPEVSEVAYLDVPLLWNNASLSGKPLAAKGYATYRLKVLVPSAIEAESLALDIPDAYSSLTVFVNEEAFFNLGKPDTSAATTIPLFRPSAKRLHYDGDSFVITLHVANFHHHRGGLVRPITIGNNDVLKNKREASRSYDLFLTGSLFMGGLFFLGLFIFGRQDKAILYFSLFCLIYAYRIIGTEEYGLHHIFPQLSWFISIRLEYATLFLAVICLALFNYFLYPEEFNIWVLRLFLGACSVGLILSTLTPTYIFTAITPVFLVIMTAKLAYTMYIYVLGFIRKRPGSVFSLLSTVLLTILFGVIVFGFYTNVYPDKVYQILLYILFFFFQSLVLSYRFAYQLNSARDEALRAYQAKSDFLSTMSHEIRTPLNSVIGITNLLLQKKPTGEQKEYLDTLLFSANNLLYIINDILDFSKIEAGKMTLHPAPAVVGLIGQRIERTSRVLAHEKGIELHFNCHPRLLELQLMIDADRTTQVINNLLQNAIKFTSKGAVTLTMELMAETEKAATVKVSVSDTGIGIPKEKQKLIFEEFTQADSSIHKGYGGTGLGLSICKEILGIQGVSLELESESGKGSTFWFQQQFIKANAEGMQAEINPVATTLDSAGVLKGKKILIVEDNAINMMVAERVLLTMDANLEIWKAVNGEEALRMYNDTPPDLILMDVNMPVMDGLTAARLIRAQEKTKGTHTPIVALTAGTLREDKDRCVEAGMDTMIAKPFKIEELRQTMIDLLMQGK